MTTIFRWGYWDWGNCADKFVKLADAVEKQAGFGKPIFVDVRYSRSSRAPNFRQGDFAKIVGASRYHWMKDLGNAGYKEGGIRIARPEAANELLDLALEAGTQGRRLIFFCACLSPWNAHVCHRRTVGKLIVAGARKRGVAVEVAEWPGGFPGSRPVSIYEAGSDDIEFLAKVERDGQVALPLGARMTKDTVAGAGLPAGTLSKVTDGKRSVFVAEMRTHFDTTTGSWRRTQIPLPKATTQKHARSEVDRILKLLALVPERS